MLYKLPPLMLLSSVAPALSLTGERGVEAPARLFAQVASNAGLCIFVLTLIFPYLVIKQPWGEMRVCVAKLGGTFSQ